MASDVPEKKDDGDGFDVVLVHGATGDGEGARVLRARPGHLEAGEVRPLREGQPLTPGAEVVRLVERTDAANAYDVKVDYKVPPALAAGPAPAKMAAGGPPQVASPAYRASWERTFAPKAQQQRSKPN
jgi:hypothetical protein